MGVEVTRRVCSWSSLPLTPQEAWPQRKLTVHSVLRGGEWVRPEVNPWEDIKLDKKSHPPATHDLSTEDTVLLAAPGPLHMLFLLPEPTSFFGLSSVHYVGLTLDITSFIHLFSKYFLCVYYVLSTVEHRGSL